MRLERDQTRSRWAGGYFVFVRWFLNFLTRTSFLLIKFWNFEFSHFVMFIIQTHVSHMQHEHLLSRLNTGIGHNSYSILRYLTKDLKIWDFSWKSFMKLISRNMKFGHKINLQLNGFIRFQWFKVQHLYQCLLVLWQLVWIGLVYSVERKMRNNVIFTNIWNFNLSVLS